MCHATILLDTDKTVLYTTHHPRASSKAYQGREEGGRGCDRVSSRVRGDLKLEAHERRETRQVSPAHHPICRSHSGFMFQSMWISRYVCKLLDGRGGDSESRETNLTIGFPVVFPPRSVAHVRATENPRPAVLGCKGMKCFCARGRIFAVVVESEVRPTWSGTNWKA